LGYFDDETCRLQPIDSLFDAKVSHVRSKSTVTGVSLRVFPLRPIPKSFHCDIFIILLQSGSDMKICLQGISKTG